MSPGGEKGVDRRRKYSFGNKRLCTPLSLDYGGGPGTHASPRVRFPLFHSTTKKKAKPTQRKEGGAGIGTSKRRWVKIHRKLIGPTHGGKLVGRIQWRCGREEGGAKGKQRGIPGGEQTKKARAKKTQRGRLDVRESSRQPHRTTQTQAAKGNRRAHQP